MTGPVGVRRGPGCGPDGLHWVTPDPQATARCACGTVTRVPPKAGRSCPPAVCYCGQCPGYLPLPERNWRRIKAELAEQARQKSERKRGRR